VIRRGRFRPLNLDLEQLMADSWIQCKEGSSFTKESNLWRSACNMFDEMASSDFEEWRSPNRSLEVVIHKVCYPITEVVLHQVFGPAGGVVEHILVIGGTDVVMASVEFDSVEPAADAYGELHGRNIYDDCCQMHIKWGLPTPAARGVDKRTSVLELTATPSVVDSIVAALAPAATSSVAHTPPASTLVAPVTTPSIAASTTTVSIELDSLDSLPTDSEVLAEHVPAEQFATGVDLHDFIDGDHIQTLLCRVNLDDHPVVLSPNTTTVVVFPIQI
jgi:hypothetical protein